MLSNIIRFLSGIRLFCTMPCLLLASCVERSVSNEAIPAVRYSTPKTEAFRISVDLGTIPRATSTNANLRWRNSNKKAISIARIQMSCECLKIGLSVWRVDPGQEVSIDVSYDGGKAPDFVGALLLEGVLFDESGVELGTIEIPVTVVENARIRLSEESTGK